MYMDAVDVYVFSTYTSTGVYVENTTLIIIVTGGNIFLLVLQKMTALKFYGTLIYLLTISYVQGDLI